MRGRIFGLNLRSRIIENYFSNLLVEEDDRENLRAQTVDWPNSPSGISTSLRGKL